MVRKGDLIVARILIDELAILKAIAIKAYWIETRL